MSALLLRDPELLSTGSSLPLPSFPCNSPVDEPELFPGQHFVDCISYVVEFSGAATPEAMCFFPMRLGSNPCSSSPVRLLTLGVTSAVLPVAGDGPRPNLGL